MVHLLEVTGCHYWTESAYPAPSDQMDTHMCSGRLVSITERKENPVKEK
jgi:hypothetical protein